MKKIRLYKIACFFVLAGLVLSSCTKNFEEINTDPNNTPDAMPQQLLAPALVSVMTYNMLRNRNFNNELMQVTVDMSDADGKVFRYDYRANWADYLYNGLYTELTNFKDMYKGASDSTSPDFNPSYMAISLICQSWIYSILTDTYGDIPYFESNKAKEGIIEPKFDRQKDIYLDIFKKLDTANTLLKLEKGIVASSDPIYNGQVKLWRRFGNSLFLRLLLRVSGKAEVAPDVIAKFQQIVADPVEYPLIGSNTESAILRWSGVAPYTSPLLTVREQDFRAPAIGSFFIDNLMIWKDPRIDLTYGTGAPTNTNRFAIAPYQGSFSGVPSGYDIGNQPVKKSYFYSITHNNGTGPTLMTEPLAGMILNYAEVQLILAEAAAKGWIPNNEETHYNAGADASIRLWLPNWPVSIQTWLDEADMQWDAAATLDEKMERIHLIKYYALFLADLQQWFEYRRTGHPVLPTGPGLRNNGEMPARMTYPVYVQSTNPTNYQIAIENQGPDLISTKVWWQKP